jgi:hypothetical protein
MEDDHGRSRGNRILWLSKGDGTFNKLTNAGGLDGTLAASQHRPYLVDVNGDGRPDVFWDAEADNSARSTGQRVLWLATGESGFTAISNFAGRDGTLVDYAVNFGDFNGDGKTDFFWDKRSGTDSRSQGQRVLWLSDGVAPDLMTGITTGVGATASFTYKSLTDGAVYARDAGAVDPIVELQGAMPVVSRLQQANGIGGQRSIAYRYAGAKAHLDGYGFLGFREITVTDEQTGIVQIATYRQEHPFTGLVAQEISRKDDVVLSSSTNTHEAIDLGGGRQQVVLRQSTAQGADLDGTRLPSSTTTYQYDPYGNAIEIAVTTSDGFSKTTTNTYANNTANWVLGRLQTATVTSQAPDLANQPPANGDPTPDPFDFADALNASPNKEYQVSTMVTGFTGPLTATVSGGGATIRKNGSGQWGTSIIVFAGETINVRMKSSALLDTTVTAVVNIAGVSADWQITTYLANRLISINSNVNNLNLRAYHDALYPAPIPGDTPQITVTATVEPNVIVGSSSIGSPAFDTGNWPSGVILNLIVKGRIQGAGGQGGRGGNLRSGAQLGQSGGSALLVRYPLNLNLSTGSGQIWGGGGGGGGGLGSNSGSSGGGGGGGSGQIPGIAGFGYGGGPNGLPGTTEAGGQGGQENDPGGDGAAPGQAGANGRNGRRQATPGGPAGVAIFGASLLTQTGTGDIRGAVKNDGTPNPFSFPNITRAISSAVYETRTNLGGFSAPLMASVSGGDARIRKNDSGAWGTSVSVSNGDMLNVKMTAPEVLNSHGASVTATIRVGPVSANWTISIPSSEGGN